MIQATGRSSAIEAPAPAAFDVSAALDRQRWSATLVLGLALIGLTMVFDAFDNQLLGLWVPVIAREFGIGKEAFSVVFAAGLIGLTIGAVAGGRLADLAGRRVILILCVAAFAASTIASAFVRSLDALLVARFVGGVGLGGLQPVALTLAAELVAPRRRNALIMLLVACIPIGGILAGAASAIVPISVGWRGLFLAGGIAPGLLLLPMIALLPESPLFLVARPERHRRLRPLLRRMGMVVASDAHLTAAMESQARVPITALVAPERRRDTIAISAAFFFAMLVSYSLQNWLPSVLDALGLDSVRRGGTMAAVYTGGLAGMLVGAFLLSRLGSRRLLLILGTGAVIVTLTLVGYASGAFRSQPLLVVLLALQAVFLGTVQAALFSLAAYIFPMAMRSTGVGTASGIGRVGAIISAFSAAAALSLTGPWGLFLSLSFLLAAMTISIHAITRHIPSETTR